jgi:hypothetical protein
VDIVVKIFQVMFYITGSAIAILTYIKAKNGLLNSVNTEYQKKVMDRLSILAKEVYDEFDRTSDKFWAKEDQAKEVLHDLHEKIIPYKHEILTKKEMPPGVKLPSKFEELDVFLNKIKSDPFVPRKIREKVVFLLEKRTKTMFTAYMQEIDAYKDGLKEGKYWDTLETNHHWFHNQINDRLYKEGCGISQIEEAAHEIRDEIQGYFESFDPIKGS